MPKGPQRQSYLETFKERRFNRQYKLGACQHAAPLARPGSALRTKATNNPFCLWLHKDESGRADVFQKKCDALNFYRTPSAGRLC